ncbi:cell growth-regulating nucleolar protein [Homalodisca vitripennis]|uniref:cell growth-regulating nucleolar protein n=1 Tax=Homalodisca vitripennis TaxID=197043 RepID=UPI001EEB2E52|nr:cell growth-regulating nucleolar protein [Homalodisca vitripennis]
MVVFTCQNCGESIQKPKVEKHYNSRCRNRDVNLTCVDCLKDFFGQDYTSHTKCVTEMERYSAHGTIIKENKGQKKQDKFVEMIPNLLNSKNLTIPQRKLLELCSKFDNVPRKRPRFKNFLMNAARHIKYSSDDVDSVFDILENALKELNQSDTNKEEAADKTPKTDKDKSSVKEATETHEDMLPVDSTHDESETKKKKKKDKNRHSSVEGSMAIGNKDCDEPGEETKENVNELSKKKLKKQKKYEKYLAELENGTKQEKGEDEISDEKMELDQSFNENHKKSKKKSKKYQTEQLNQQENGFESENTEGKKSKKRRRDESICDVTEKKLKGDTIEDEEPTSQSTFDWADVITRVLESRPDKELSLKRLGKKVIDEYQTVKSDHRSYEELLAKFNKKVKKVKGVKVLKDKAKLAEEC